MRRSSLPWPDVGSCRPGGNVFERRRPSIHQRTYRGWFSFECLEITPAESPRHRLRSYLFVEVDFERAGFSQRQPSAGRLISVNRVRIFFSGFLLTDPVMMR